MVKIAVSLREAPSAHLRVCRTIPFAHELAYASRDSQTCSGIPIRILGVFGGSECCTVVGHEHGEPHGEGRLAGKGSPPGAAEASIAAQTELDKLPEQFKGLEVNGILLKSLQNRIEKGCR